MTEVDLSWFDEVVSIEELPQILSLMPRVELEAFDGPLIPAYANLLDETVTQIVEAEADEDEEDGEDVVKKGNAEGEIIKEGKASVADSAATERQQNVNDGSVKETGAKQARAAQQGSEEVKAVDVRHAVEQDTPDGGGAVEEEDTAAEDLHGKDDRGPEEEDMVAEEQELQEKVPEESKNEKEDDKIKLGSRAVVPIPKPAIGSYGRTLLSMLSVSNFQRNDGSFNRELFFEMYRALRTERALQTRRNTVLQRKLYQHYKKRKMDAIFKIDVPVTPEMEAKYAKKLNMYYEIKTIEETEKAVIESELKCSSDAQKRQERQLEEAFNELMQLERETGIGLIDTQTGLPISEMLVDRYIKRQMLCAEELGMQRLAYIQIRDMVTSKETAIRDLDIVGGGLRMHDYDQLRIENQQLCDKMEEREIEVSRVRERTTQALHALAHYREKSSAITSDIENKMYNLREQEEKLARCRANLGSLKVIHDQLRAEYDHENNEAGLLNKPDLLRDFDIVMKTVAGLTDKLDNVSNTFADEERQLIRLRKAIELCTDYQCISREFYRTHGHYREKRSVHSLHEEEEEEEIFQMQ